MANTNELWRRFKLNNDSQAREEIISNYAYLAKYIVDRLNIRPTAAIGYDDLVSHAIVGLIDAVEKFDLSKDVKFETYAVVRIRGAVLDAIKTMDWLPRSVRTMEIDLRKTFASLEAELGRPARDEEVAATLGVDIDRFNSMLADIGQSAILSLEELMLYGEEGTDLTASRNGTDPDRNPMLAAELQERKRIIAIAIDNLPEREKLVISLYYNDGLTLKEIAAVLGVTESRVCQLHSKAVVRLQGKLARHSELLLTAA